MRSIPWLLLLSLAFLGTAAARDIILPAGTLLQCTLDEPNFSSATAEVGDPILCHPRAVRGCLTPPDQQGTRQWLIEIRLN